MAKKVKKTWEELWAETMALQEKAKTTHYILTTKEELFAMSCEEVKYALRWNMPFFKRVVELLSDVVEEILAYDREENEDERIMTLEEALHDPDYFGSSSYESACRYFGDVLLGCIADNFAE